MDSFTRHKKNMALSGGVEMNGTFKKSCDVIKIHNRKEKLKQILYSRIPIFEWLPKYNRVTCIADFIAGISLGLTLIPQSIAYASLANLTAEYGLYSSFIGTMLYAVFGTVKEVSIGPTSLMSILIFQYCKNYTIEYVILLGFLSGLVIILMAILQLGFLVELISLPVTSGFTSATATVIIVSQIKGILGMRYKAENFVDNLVQLYKKHQMARWQDAVLGLSCIAFLLVLRQLKDAPVKSPKLQKTLWFVALSRNALVVGVTALIAYFLDQNGPAPFLLSDKIPVGLPPFELPKFSVTQGNHTANFIQMCQQLGSGIIVVPVTAVLANIGIAKAFTMNKKLDATQEMLSLGICQLVGSFVHAIPSTGAFTRSAVSNASGVKTPFAGIYSGILAIFSLTFLTQYFYYIPRATLSAILISAVMFLIDYKVIKLMWKGNRWDVFLLTITYFVSLLKGVEIGILVGVLVNICYLTYLAARPNVEIRRNKTSTGCDYVLVTPGAGLYFLSISFISDVIKKAASVEGENVLPIVVDCSKFQAIDYSACKGLENLTKIFEKRNQQLVFLNVTPKIVDVLEPLTNIHPSMYHCQDEEDMMDVMFAVKAEDALRSETLPLLSESFRKKDSIASENCVSYEMTEHKVLLENVNVEPIKEELSKQNSFVSESEHKSNEMKSMEDEKDT